MLLRQLTRLICASLSTFKVIQLSWLAISSFWIQVFPWLRKYFLKITSPAFSHHLFTLPPAYLSVYHSTALFSCLYSTRQKQVSTANTYCPSASVPSITLALSFRLFLMKDAYQPILSSWVHGDPLHCLSCQGRSPSSTCRFLYRTLHWSVFQ